MSISILLCFNSDGSSNDDHVPCNPDGNSSACCPSGTQCVNNLYCRSVEDGSELPGSCTNGYWGGSLDPACPCLPRAHNGGTIETYRDGTTTCGFDGFICGPFQEALCGSAEVLPVIDYGNPNVIPDDRFGESLTTYYDGLSISTASLYPVTTLTETTSAISAVLMSGTTLAETTSIPSSTSLRNSTLAISTTPMYSPPAATPASPPPADEGLSSSTKAGIGVAAGIGVPLILALLLIAFCLRRKSKSRQSSPMQSPEFHHTTAYRNPVSTTMTLPEITDSMQKSHPPSMLYEVPSPREVRELPGCDVEGSFNVERRKED